MHDEMRLVRYDTLVEGMSPEGTFTLIVLTATRTSGACYIITITQHTIIN